MTGKQSGLVRSCTNGFLVLAMVLMSACSSAVNLIGVGDEALQKPEPGITRHEIFFSTTRARSSDNQVFFGGARNYGLTSGKVTVGVPSTHRSGQLELPRNAKDHDPQTEFSFGEPLLFDGTQTFINRLQAEVNSRAPRDRSVLVFVHGYNTSYSAAVARFSQFVHDTGYKGVPVLFTWASRGQTVEYVYDLNSSLQARFHMTELALAMEKVKVNDYSIVAHSMGNLVTLETLVVLEGLEQFNPQGNLKTIILAAPDVDIDLFTEHMRVLKRVRNKIYVLISKDDGALRASRLIAGGVTRAGAANPVRLADLGIKVVDLSALNDPGGTEHSKFANSPEIVQLIGRSINSGNTLTSQTEDTKVKSLVGGIFRKFSLAPGGGSILALGN